MSLKAPKQTHFPRSILIVILFQTSFDMLATDAESDRVTKELASHLTWAGGWFAFAPIRVGLLAVAALRSLTVSNDVEASKVEQMHIDEGVGLLNLYALATYTNSG
jgi:hypothetical protein